MSQPRTCDLCREALTTKPFWDNLRIHKECLAAVIEQVIVQAGEVKVKEVAK